MASIDGLGDDRHAVGAGLDQVAAAVGGGDDEEVGAAASGTRTFSPSRTTPSPSAARLHREAPGVAGEPASQSAGHAAQLAGGERPQEALALVVGAAEA